MISADLLKIICCPETKEPLHLATYEELMDLNAQITAGNLKTIDGKTVTANLESALIRQDRKIVYRIDNDIPILLIHEGIRIS